MQFSALLAFVAASSATAISSKNPNVLSRGEDGEISCERPACVDAGNLVERESFVEGQETLRNGGDCYAAAGECARTSCSWDAGMFLCAPDDQDVTIDCGIIADYMDHIFDECQSSGQTYVDAAHGWQENSDGWWVSVGWSYC